MFNDRAAPLKSAPDQTPDSAEVVELNVQPADVTVAAREVLQMIPGTSIQALVQASSLLQAAVADAKPEITADNGHVPVGSLARDLKTTTETWFEKNKLVVPGVVVAAGIAGETVLDHAEGRAKPGNPSLAPSTRESHIAPEARMNPDAAFRIGSLSKMFAGVAAMQLVETGHLDLRAPISDYLEDLRGSVAGNITMEQLLTHTSGLPGIETPRFPGVENSPPWEPAYWVEGDRSRMTAEGVKNDLKAAVIPEGPPRFSYSNFGYAVAGLVIERIASAAYGKDISYGAYIKEKIFDRAGMSDSSADYDADNEKLCTGFSANVDGALTQCDQFAAQAYAPGAGMVSTASDVRQFGEALLRSDSPLLGQESKKLLFETRVEPPKGFPGNYALGFVIGRDESNKSNSMIGHSGQVSGFQGCALFDRESGATCAVLINQFYDPREKEEGTSPREVAEELMKQMGRA